MKTDSCNGETGRTLRGFLAAGIFCASAFPLEWLTRVTSSFDVNGPQRRSYQAHCLAPRERIK
jgi:hypothetical protein